MKKILLLCGGVLGMYVSQAQQNFFNMPSGDITPKGKTFYQHQLNVYNQQVESKGHFVYGLGKGRDIGINVVGKGVDWSDRTPLLFNDKIQNGAVYPVIMGTFQQQIKLNQQIFVNIGTQGGTNVSGKENRMHFHHFSYGLLVAQDKKGNKITGGVYHTNRPFVGPGNTSGIMLGYEYKLSKHWFLMGDWISGNNESGVAVIGGMYQLNKRVQLCAGWQIPNPGTPKRQALVLEINLLGWDFLH